MTSYEVNLQTLTLDYSPTKLQKKFFRTKPENVLTQLEQETKDPCPEPHRTAILKLMNDIRNSSDRPAFIKSLQQPQSQTQIDAEAYTAWCKNGRYGKKYQCPDCEHLDLSLSNLKIHSSTIHKTTLTDDETLYISKVYPETSRVFLTAEEGKLFCDEFLKTQRK